MPSDLAGTRGLHVRLSASFVLGRTRRFLNVLGCELTLFDAPARFLLFIAFSPALGMLGYLREQLRLPASSLQRPISTRWFHRNSPWPPSTHIGDPVMCRALSDARNAMTSATSELLPGLPPVMGTWPPGQMTGITV